MTQVLEVSTATPTREAAVALTESAVTARLAAGGQVLGPVMSFFWHDGAFGQGEAWKVSLKTTSERYPDLEAHLIANHPWSNPEVIAVTVSHASPGCVDWVERFTSQKLRDSV